MIAPLPFAAAFERFKDARAIEAAYDATTWTPACNVHDRGGPRIPEAINAEMERLTEVRCDAEDVLIAAPAPDLASVIWKIDYARPRWEDFCDWPDDWWIAVMSDLRRLAGDV